MSWDVRIADVAIDVIDFMYSTTETLTWLALATITARILWWIALALWQL